MALDAAERAKLRRVLGYAQRTRRLSTDEAEIESAFDRVDARTAAGDANVEAQLLAEVAVVENCEAKILEELDLASIGKAGSVELTADNAIEGWKNRGRRAAASCARLLAVKQLGDLFSGSGVDYTENWVGA